MLLVIFALLARNLARSRIGRAFAAVRDRDIAAEMMGVNLARTKMLAFAISSFYAGCAGALLYTIIGFFDPASFNLLLSVQFIAMVLIGGAGTISGSIMGALFISLLPTLTRELPNYLPLDQQPGHRHAERLPGRVDPLRAAHRRVPDLRTARPVRHLGPDPALLEELALQLLAPLGTTNTGTTNEGDAGHETAEDRRPACDARSSSWRAAGGGGEDEGDGEVSAPGVTSEPCPEAVNEDNGCIYLGQISDLTEGPFAPLGVPITDAMKAFWQRVNEDGGIGGYDIDVDRVRPDNLYNPETHKQVYNEIKGDVLALAQTLGSPTTVGDPREPQERRGPRGTGLLDLAVGRSRTSSSSRERRTAWSR